MKYATAWGRDVQEPKGAFAHDQRQQPPGRNNHARTIIDHATAHRAGVQDEVLTIAEVADILRPGRQPALLAPPRHRTSQLPHGTHRAHRALSAPGVTTWVQRQSSTGEQPDPGPGGEAARRGWRGAGAGNVWSVTSVGSGHRKTLRTGLDTGVSTTFGGTWPDLRKDQRTPLGVRAWGGEVGDVPAP